MRRRMTIFFCFLYSLTLCAQSPYEKQLDKIFLNMPVAKLTRAEIEKIKTKKNLNLLKTDTLQPHNMVMYVFNISRHEYFPNSLGGELIFASLPDSFNATAITAFKLKYETKNKAKKDFKSVFKMLTSDTSKANETKVLQDTNDESLFTYSKKYRQVKCTLSGLKDSGQWFLIIEFDGN